MQDFLLNNMKTGRPKLENQNKKDKIAGVRLRADERELLERAASRREQKLSEWMRETLIVTAEDQMK